MQGFVKGMRGESLALQMVIFLQHTHERFPGINAKEAK
jgi:hypothetical protein